MSTDEFKSVLSTIYLSLCKQSSAQPPDLSHEQYATIRMLDSLGHCEFDFDNRRVHVCPPLIATLPTHGLLKAVLTGARDRNLVDNLKHAVKNMHGSTRLIRHQQGGYPMLPEAIIVESSDLETMKQTANTAKIAYEESIAAWEIVNYACGMDEVAKPSAFVEKEELNWKRRVFSTKHMQFMKHVENPDETKLVEYVNPLNQQRVHWIWKGTFAAEVDRDWGRYMALANSGVSVLIYDKLRNSLSVPERVPLPRLFARALALCSGIAPTRTTISADNKLGFPPNIPVNIFSQVPPDIIDILSGKLSQAPIIHEIEIDKNGEIS